MIIAPDSLMARVGEAMNVLNGLAERHPDAISFAAGRPAAEVVAWPTLDDALDASRIARAGTAAWQYGPTPGLLGPLISALWAADEGGSIDPEAVIATTGAQEALWLVLTALFEPGDVLLVPDPTYVGATGAAAVARVPVAPVWPLTPERVAATVEALAAEGRRARALYLVPDFANPEGDTLDEATRRALVALARRTGLLLLEDSPYRAFAFEAPPPPSLLALDGQGHVVQLGSFAKTLSPGLRLGWLAWPGAPAEAFAALVRAKSFVTLNTSALTQALAEGFVRRSGAPGLRALTAPARSLYRSRRDALVDALERRLGRVDARWSTPGGGFFLSLRLPFDFDTDDMHACAARHGVLVCPMHLFSPTGRGRDTLRLAFANVEPDQIAEGVDRLARALEARC